MAGKDTQDALPAIGKGIYLIKPSGKPAGRAPIETQPDLILIFGWMGAKLPHIIKYTKVYDELYPDATKIVIRSEPKVFWSTESRKRANLAPVVEALEALGYLPAPGKSKQKYGAPLEPLLVTPPPRVLVHAFSNGGCWQLTTLSTLLQERFEGIEVVPAPSAVILDSCPSNAGVKETQKAFTTAIRNPILKRLAAILITLMIYFATFMERVFGLTPPIEVMRRALNQHNLLPWFSKATARLYIYSKTDELMPTADVEGHAELAQRNGLQVRLEKYEVSPHVAHARTDPVRYWNGVKLLWQHALKTAS